MARLAILFPGIGYTCDKPLLYYAEKMAIKNVYETKRVVYRSLGDTRIRGNREKIEEAVRFLYACSEEFLSDIDFTQYDEILFISKSIGTIIAAEYASKMQAEVRHILYTPLEDTFRHSFKNAISFIGTADPWSNVQDVIDLAKAKGVSIYIYDNANHSLETGEVLKDIETVQDVMIKTEAFITGTL